MKKWLWTLTGDPSRHGGLLISAFVSAFYKRYRAAGNTRENVSLHNIASTTQILLVQTLPTHKFAVKDRIEILQHESM